MKPIPLHHLEENSGLLEFEVMPWQKDLSKYDATLPHRHSYYEILVFFKGGGKHEIDFKHYRIKSRSLHFISANQVHEVKRTPGSDGFSLLFSEEFLPKTNIKDFEFYRPDAYPITNLSVKEFSTLNYILQEIREEYFNETRKKRDMLQSLLQLLLLKLQRFYLSNVLPEREKSISNKSPLISRFESLVNNHFREHWRASAYAKEINISVAQLNNECKKHLSLSTEAFIQNMCVIEIKRLLVYSDKAIKEICYELNFEDPAYFARFFKKKTKLTPQEYRNAVKE